MKKLVDILLDYIKEENNRDNKILDFYHPEQMLKKIDLSIPDEAMNLGQILKVFIFE